mgnify:CR=1 FL=1
MCEARKEKVSNRRNHVWIKEMIRQLAENLPIACPDFFIGKASRKRYKLSKPRYRALSGISIAVTCFIGYVAVVV